VALETGCLEDEGYVSQRRMPHHSGQAVVADMAGSWVRVLVAPGPERGSRIVQVYQAQPVQQPEAAQLLDERL
jgi:hypothetical protein